MSTAVKSLVKGVAHYVPPRRVTNQDLQLLMETSDSWIQERTGIKERRFVAEGVTTSHIGTFAAQHVLKNTDLKPNDIDFIIAATLSPDLFFPGIGVQIQSQLNFPPVGCLDIRAQCSGFIYALSMANALIKSGAYSKILVVCAEVQSRVLDLTTKGRDVGVLFGDGAGALILEKCTDGTAANRGVIDTLLGADGSGAEMLCLKTPGLATPGFVTNQDIELGKHFPYMEGKAVFKHAVSRMIEACTSILDRNHLTVDDIDLFIPHQANLRINEMVAAKLNIPSHKVFNNIQNYGNTTSATIPICLSEAQEQGKLEKGKLVLTVAFGAGFTWGAALVRW